LEGRLSSVTDIAIAACRSSEQAAPDDLTPDPDFPLLTEAFATAGMSCCQLAWDNPEVRWVDFAAVVIRSTWDSDVRPEAYLAWARATSLHTSLVNPFAAVKWCLDKTYLADLGADGVPIVPTRFVPPGQAWAPPEGEFVVKPTISAGGRSTARYQPDELDQARRHIDALHGAGRSVMVQPYMGGVEDEGELKMIYTGGTFSHAVRVQPILDRGAGIVDRLWERPTCPQLVEPSASQLAIATAAVAAAERRLGVDLAYARADLVPGATGEPMVSELEIIDPSLFLTFGPKAAAALAERVAALM
jgi:hypothetical protein